MWESPTTLWSRLRLGREEFLQRLVTTLILDGETPPWNSPRVPGAAGQRFLRFLDQAAHGPHDVGSSPHDADEFVDEYLLPKLEEDAANGWPDWAVLWSDRVWIIELKTEASSHRPDQLPYYLELAAAAHPRRRLDLTYITGTLSKPPPTTLEGQRYAHLTWDQVLLLIEQAWSEERRPEVTEYLQMVRTIIENLNLLKPAAQRGAVVGSTHDQTPSTSDSELALRVGSDPLAGGEAGSMSETGSASLLDLAAGTARDGKQRAVGAQSPEQLEALRDQAMREIDTLAPDDPARWVLPWLWDGARTGGAALTAEGAEFGFELRFSRYKSRQVKP